MMQLTRLASADTPALLADFQRAFSRALMTPLAADVAGPLANLTTQPGFSVYRNTVIKGCIDALQANYPAVARLVGDEWFRAAAAVYARESPPVDTTLVNYGSSFSVFLEHFEPAKELPYLPGVARLDRLWTEAHIARDETILDASALVGLTPKFLATTVLYPHAAARWAWFTESPIYSIWSRNRNEIATDDGLWEPVWQSEGALITRAHGVVEWVALNPASYAFLDACASGGTLAEAAKAALTAQADADLQRMMATLLEAGTFNRMSNTRRRQF